MTSQALVDLTPLLRLALLGVVLALGPLAWVWLRHRGGEPGSRLRALTWLTLFLTFDLVLVGAFTRLTDSGLGCPDWPGCYGNASPVGAQAQIHAAQSAMPTGPVTHGKAWIEMLHRYLATGVGVLITVLAIAAWVEVRKRRAALSPSWATATLAWVCVQGAFGALTVTMKLYPAIVTAHLLGGLALLVLLAVQAEAFVPRPLALPRGRHALAWAVLALCVVQVALGGWVSTNYAVLACSDFPTCQGAWWPDMDFQHGFTVRRELGIGHDGAAIPFAALTAIHMTHRIGAAVVFVAIALLAWRLARGDAAQRRFAVGLAAVAAWQFASGLGNVVLGWPLVAAVAHTGGAAALITLLATLLARAQRARRQLLSTPAARPAPATWARS
ncbi:MAG TPA: COX15/CtaA family protein [Albitalea sp.]|uniref:COX15/CtaA family protein n=1 Tax=Piscinibacter sp. TaxID=1903157 RepID=UPI002ED4C9BC